jgi:GNAT superfamily N-acetyltransferase
MRVREAQSGDEQDWRRLWDGYCRFYECALPDRVTARTWARILEPASGMIGRVAEVDGRVSGFSVCVLHGSSWTEAPCCYLEDLFVETSARGSGIGRALIDDLVALAKERGWPRLYWMTRADNTAARRLYDRYAEADGFVRYRLPIESAS